MSGQQLDITAASFIPSRLLVGFLCVEDRDGRTVGAPIKRDCAITNECGQEMLRTATGTRQGPPRCPLSGMEDLHANAPSLL